MLFINGEWREGAGELFQSHCPADNALVWEGRSAAPADVDAAFAAARAAFAEWGRRLYPERVAMVDAYKAHLEANKEELGDLIAKETGKPRWESITEAAAMIGKVDISKAAYKDRTGEFSNETAFGYAAMAHKPLGVMFVLGPYNFPGHLPNATSSRLCWPAIRSFSNRPRSRRVLANSWSRPGRRPGSRRAY